MTLITANTNQMNTPMYISRCSLFEMYPIASLFSLKSLIFRASPKVANIKETSRKSAPPQMTVFPNRSAGGTSFVRM